ncbi:amino acid permease/ SLC12A domain-containing protein [Hypomontagnella monticulosa]|nr:amino acid permease/ SLC12A domain-containing protein [Hypomontagnella monticulosa]
MDLPRSVPVAEPSLQKVITTRQFVFMALSSSIGAGVLLATYSSLAVGGPGSLLLSFAIVGFAVWITMCALGELSAAFPVSGSFYEYSVRFISPAWGFAMGWNYVINFLLIVVFELVVILLCVRYWVSDIPAYYVLPPFITGLILVNAFGAKWYAEAENVFAVCKMFVLSGFVIVAILIITKSIPNDSRPASELGFNLWKEDAFRNGVIGFLYVFMAAGMAYGGTEMLGLTAAECENPRNVMPLACNIVPVRIIWLYLLPIFMLGLVLKVPLDETVQAGGISPFVDAIDQAGIPELATIFNGVIIVAIFSMANASVFASSRALQAISARGMGPSFFAKIKWGHPIWALVLVFCVSLLSLVKIAKDGDMVFDWLLALAAGSNYFTWISICVCHIRLRLAIRKKGVDENEILKWKSPVGIVGSVVAILVFLFGLSAQIAAAIHSPLPKPPPILASVLGIIIVFTFWAGYTVFKRDTLLISLDQIDLNVKTESTASLRRSHDVESDAESLGIGDTRLVRTFARVS